MQESYVYVVFYYNDYYKNFIHQNIKCFDEEETALDYANQFVDDDDDSQAEYLHYDDIIYDHAIRRNKNESSDDFSDENDGIDRVISPEAEDLIEHINDLVFMDYPRIAIFKIVKA